MSTTPRPVVALSEMVPNQDGDLFALLASKSEHRTREGKPYFQVGFRDARREVNSPIWEDSPWFEACRDEWTAGCFYKLRAIYRETSYGPQLDVVRIRAAEDTDCAAGFDPQMLMPRSRFSSEEMFAELRGLAEQHIVDAPLCALVTELLDAHRAQLLTLPAATHNHHAYVGGFLEHVLSVARTCVFLADKYADYYPDLNPPLDKGLVVAGGILHDIGKLREIEPRPVGAEYTPAGKLVGHILQGRDMVREAAARRAAGDAAAALDPERLLRLEHIIVSHQRLPEWGSPKPPMTPEAVLVHYADDLDAKYNMVYAVLRDADAEAAFTSNRNALRQAIFRGFA